VILSVCSYCKTNELRNTDCICPRCHLPAYCSAKCRKADWNDKHKATCVPKDLPEPPEPVGDANVGDERFERSRKYVDMATQAGRDGRFAEQIKLMEALVEKDPMQLAAYLQLYERYSERDDHEKTLFYLKGAVELFLDPRLTEPSFPQSAGHPVQPTYKEMYGRLILSGHAFIRDHRVRGRCGPELIPDSKVLWELAILSDRIPLEDTSVINRYQRSQMYDTLGNIFRKIGGEKERKIAIMHCRMADEVLKPIDERSFTSLLMIPEILNEEATNHAKTPEEMREKSKAAADEAREVLELTKQLEFNWIHYGYQAQILLGTMIYNQVHIERKIVGGDIDESFFQKKMREAYDLLAEGHKNALEQGNMYFATRAKAVLDRILSKPET